jgi:uncharacterized protein DUF4349
MKLVWGKLCEKSRNRLKAAWLVTAGVVAIYVGAVAPINEMRTVRQERASGLAAVAEWQPASMWHGGYTMRLPMLQKGVIGGVPGGTVDRARVARSVAEPASASAYLDSDDERKVIRIASMDLVAKIPRETSEKIRQLAERSGGFVERAETYGGESASSASLTIRVPVNKFPQVRDEIGKLALRVESEKLNAQDVTKQYVDLAARLRNLRAQETQYLTILKQAKTVKDTIEVTDKLDEVRGQIEQQQAEFDALSKQVETVALSVTLRAETEVQVFGLNWRPLYQLKLAARQGLESLADYAAAMASLLFFLPTVLLWLATILIGAALGWRGLRWAGKALFARRPVVVTTQ